jgi:Asp-tRNA(Asn)/Glu-tRNA(Gln) amidotransferase C subunit
MDTLNNIRSELIQQQAYLARIGSNREQQDRISTALKQIDNYLKSSQGQSNCKYTAFA